MVSNARRGNCRRVFPVRKMRSIIKKQLIETDELLLAADEGFEPSQTESESGVLPLHKSAKRSSYYTVKSEFVNTHSEIFEKKQAIF